MRVSDALRIVGQTLRQGRKHARPGLEQDDARRARIDAAEILGDGVARDLGDGAGHLDAGRAGADDHEREQPPPLGLVVGQFRLLECQQDAAADAGGVLDALEARRHRRPFVMAEIGVRRAGRDDQRVVGDRARSDQDAPPRGIDAGHLRHQHGRVRLLAQDVPDRPGDIGRRQRGGRDLIEQRLKAVVVLRSITVTSTGARGERLRRFQPAEAGADDDDVGSTVHDRCPRSVLSLI